MTKNSKTNEMYHPFLIGERIYLRALERKDMDGNWWQWSNDQEVTAFMTQGRFPNYYEKMQEFYESMAASKEDIPLAIIDKETNTHVGNVGLHGIHWMYRLGEIGIILGEREFYGRGYGSEALRLLTQHAFNRLGLVKIWARTDKDNIASRKSFKKAGFEEEAILKMEAFWGGKYHDAVYLSCFNPNVKRESVATYVES